MSLSEKRTTFWHILDKKIIFFLLFFGGLQINVFPYNSIRFQNIRVSDGLKMGSTYGVQIDHKGFAWIATAEGIYRYDGVKLLHFNKHFDTTKNSLSDSYVTSITIWKEYLFIGYFNGAVDAMNTENFTIQPVLFNQKDEPRKDIITVLKISGHHLFIGTEGDGLWWLDSSKELVAKKYNPQLFREAKIIDFLINQVDTLILTSDNLYLRKNKKYQKINLKEQNLTINALVKFKDTLFVGTYNGLYFLNKNTNLFEKKSIPIIKRRSRSINHFLVTSNNDLWIGTEGGLLIYTQGKFRLQENNPINNFSICSDKIQHLDEDKNGTIWISTISGLSRYSPVLRKFGLVSDFELRDTLYSNNIYMIYPENSGDIWVGTLSSGLFLFDKNFTIKDNYYHIGNDEKSTRAVRSFLKDSKGRYWVGTRDEGLFLFSPNNRTFKPIANMGNSIIESNVIRHLYEDKSGSIWISTANGLYVLNANLEISAANLNFSKKEFNKNVYQILEDAKNPDHLIVALFRGGIKIYSKKKNRVIKHFTEESHSIGMKSNNVMCLEWKNKDEILFGTYGGGCGILHIRKNSIKSFTENEGIPNNIVYAILSDGNNNAWITTNNGIVKWEIDKGTFIPFKLQHYVQNLEFNEGAFGKTDNGYYLFGGISGMNYFKPNEIKYNTTKKPLYLTDIRGDITKKTTQKITLKHSNSRLEIDFIAIYLADPNSIKYRYKLKNHDEDWQTPFYTNTAYYPKISHGKYTFMLEATDEYGMWQSEINDFEIVIIPPLYKRWWFIITCILLVGALIYYIFKIQTQKLKESFKLQMVNSELRAIRSQLNPHFIFNSLNSIQYFILNKEPKEAYNYLSKFAVLMRKILQNSRVRFLQLTEEIASLDLYLTLEKLRLDHNLTYDISVEGFDKIDDIYIPTMLTQPFVENAIIHGLLPLEGERKLRIRFKRFSDMIRIEVEDNGIGIEAAEANSQKRKKLHQSAGLELTKKRLEMLSDKQHKYHFTVESLTHGTRVLIDVPYYDHPQDKFDD